MAPGLSDFILAQLQVICGQLHWPSGNCDTILISTVTIHLGSAALAPSLCDYILAQLKVLPGHVAQSVTCLITDARLTEDLGVGRLIPAKAHTFREIDHKIFSMSILFPSPDSFKRGCCQLQAEECARITCSSLPRKKCG